MKPQNLKVICITEDDPELEYHKVYDVLQITKDLIYEKRDDKWSKIESMYYMQQHRYRYTYIIQSDEHIVSRSDNKVMELQKYRDNQLNQIIHE